MNKFSVNCWRSTVLNVEHLNASFSNSVCEGSVNVLKVLRSVPEFSWFSSVFPCSFCSSPPCLSTLSADDAATASASCVHVVDQDIVAVVWIWIHICRGGLEVSLANQRADGRVTQGVCITCPTLRQRSDPFTRRWLASRSQSYGAKSALGLDQGCQTYGSQAKLGLSGISVRPSW